MLSSMEGEGNRVLTFAVGLVAAVDSIAQSLTFSLRVTQLLLSLKPISRSLSEVQDCTAVSRVGTVCVGT